jgi:hypothetical protein
MSATVVRHPEAWTKAVSRIKADIVAGRDDADLLTPNLKVGVSTNFNKLVSSPSCIMSLHGMYYMALPATCKTASCRTAGHLWPYGLLSASLTGSLLFMPNSWHACCSRRMLPCTSVMLQCACVLMDLVDPNLYITMLPEAMKKVEKEFNKDNIIKLYDTVDFIGISSYSGEGCSPTEFDTVLSATQC